MSEKIYKAGSYLRLSKDDERAGESVSIENQRLLLAKYAEEKNWEVEDVYIDDGFSGTNFQRPGFQKMMRDVENKRINLVIVKDLSRLGRNYIEVGRLTEETLPKLNCRFIAVNDYVDSELGENEMAVYRNLFNEFHSKETSKKVRTVKRACMEQGKYLGTYAPFGYRKDPANKYHLVIDEETSPIVRKIFALRCAGKGMIAITDALNSEHIPSPRAMYYRRAGRQNPLKENGFWNLTYVKSILSSEIYIGHMVQGKCGTVSYKNHSVVKKSKDQWVRVENTHEPIIDTETWEFVRSLDEKILKPRADSDGELHLFTGLLKCGDCGFNHRAHIKRRTLRNGEKVRRIGYICGNYARSGKSACSLHIIQEPALIQVIVDDIHRHAQSVSYDETRVIEQIRKAKHQENDSMLGFHRQELKSAESRICDLDKIVQTLYEDRVNGVITDVMFKNMSAKYEAERGEKAQYVKTLRRKIEQNEHDDSNINSWVSTIRKYSEIETLTQDILIELIDKIEVFEAENITGKRVCRIKIYYRFVGDLSESQTEAGEAYEAV